MASHSIPASVCHEAQRRLQQKMLVVARAGQKRKILGLCYLHWMGMKIQLQCAHRDLTTRVSMQDNINAITCNCAPVAIVALPHFVTMAIIVSLGN